MIERVRWTTALVCAAAIAAALPGCQRRVQLVPAEADSTAQTIDSSAVHMRTAQQLWERTGEEAVAAELSARMVAEMLPPVAPASWRSRADAVLDSLGIGHESAAGNCALAVNFFDRSDPSAGSWPYLFWCGETRVRMQEIQGRGLRLLELTARGIEAGADTGRGVAVLFARRGGGGLQPLVMAWRGRGLERWELIQTLGADSLGGVGTAEFDAFEDTTVLVTRTYRTVRGFDECATCPHVYTVRRFKWAPGGFERIETREVPSTYSSFVRFIQALLSDDREESERRVDSRSVIDQARRYELHRPRGAWRVAPATDESPNRIVFYRGEDEAYRVDFVPRGGEWVIAAIESVPRVVD